MRSTFQDEMQNIFSEKNFIFVAFLPLKSSEVTSNKGNAE